MASAKVFATASSNSPPKRVKKRSVRGRTESASDTSVSGHCDSQPSPRKKKKMSEFEEIHENKPNMEDVMSGRSDSQPSPRKKKKKSEFEEFHENKLNMEDMMSANLWLSKSLRSEQEMSEEESQYDKSNIEGKTEINGQNHTKRSELETTEEEYQDDKPSNESKSDVSDWPREDLDTLLDRILEVLPSEDKLKCCKQAEKIKWDQVKFGAYSVEECQDCWNWLLLMARRLQTMTQVITCAKQLINMYPGLKKHPDMPKKPNGPFFEYLAKHRRKYAEKNPGIQPTEITRQLAEKYRNLDEKTRGKFIVKNNQKLEEYKKQMAKFRKDHPEWIIAEVNNKKMVKEFPKCPTPLSLFTAKKLPEYMEKNPTMTKKECFVKCRKKWTKLSDSKKMKWIKKSIEATPNYESHVAEILKERPNATFRKVKVLTKEEQRIRDEQMGKPKKPPGTVWNYFISKHFDEVEDPENSSSAVAVLVERWRKMRDEEKQKYKEEWKESKRRYEDDLKEFLRDLSEEDQDRIIQAENLKSLTVKPNLGLSVYIEDQKECRASENPELTRQEVVHILRDEYSQLSEEEKDPYIQREVNSKSVKQTVMTDFVISSISRSKNDDSLPKSMPGEPKKPPSNGYRLFTADCLAKMSDIPSHFRMAVIGKNWGKMSEDEKNQYRVKADKMNAKYKKRLERFKESLSPGNLAVFQKILISRKPKIQKKMPSKVKGTKKI